MFLEHNSTFSAFEISYRTRKISAVPRTSRFELKTVNTSNRTPLNHRRNRAGGEPGPNSQNNRPPEWNSGGLPPLAGLPPKVFGLNGEGKLDAEVKQRSGYAIPVSILSDGPADKDHLKRLISSHNDLEIVSECDDLETARNHIADSDPTLVVLNVGEPRQAGFELIDELSNASQPLLILVTASDDYVMRAVDSRTVGCLRKPIEKERFERAIERVREHIEQSRDAELGRWLQGVLRQMVAHDSRLATRESSSHFLERLTVKRGKRVLFVPTNEIDYIEASGNYVAVHSGGKNHLVYETMVHLENQLDPRRFLRIHRSHIVNVGRIRELQPDANGEYVAVLNTGAKLKIGRRYRNRTRTALGIP
jgi:two-component system LytT family response regulator